MIEITGVEFGVYVTNSKVIEAKIQDQGTSLVIRAKSIGSALCTVYLIENPSIFDTFYVSVGTIVVPSSPVYVHVGGFIYFSVSSSGSSKADPVWRTEQKNVLEIDSYSGKAVALKEGKANVMLSSVIQYSTRVNTIIILL